MLWILAVTRCGGIKADCPRLIPREIKARGRAALCKPAASRHGRLPPTTMIKDALETGG